MNFGLCLENMGLNGMRSTSFDHHGKPIPGFWHRVVAIPPVKTGGYLQCVPPGRFAPQPTVRLQSTSKPPDEIAAKKLSQRAGTCKIDC